MAAYASPVLGSSHARPGSSGDASASSLPDPRAGWYEHDARSSQHERELGASRQDQGIHSPLALLPRSTNREPRIPKQDGGDKLSAPAASAVPRSPPPRNSAARDWFYTFSLRKTAGPGLLLSPVLNFIKMHIKGYTKRFSMQINDKPIVWINVLNSGLRCLAVYL
jgi:hypothetical protein